MARTEMTLYHLHLTVELIVPFTAHAEHPMMIRRRNFSLLFGLTILFSILVTSHILNYGGFLNDEYAQSHQPYFYRDTRLRQEFNTSNRVLDSEKTGRVGVRGAPVSRGWQSCDDRGDVFVYSAHYSETEHNIRVVGIVLREGKRNITCIFPETPQLTDVQASVDVLPDHNEMASAAAVVDCNLPMGNVIKPNFIGIKVGEKITYLSVIYPYPQARQFNFTVCMPCLFGLYKDYSGLFEMLETDLMSRDGQFLLYNHSVTPQVDKVLQYHVQKGKVEVFPWESPNVSIHYYSQAAIKQDCILSSRGRTKYLFIKDLDQLIVPDEGKHWLELMNFDTGKEETAFFLSNLDDPK